MKKDLLGDAQATPEQQQQLDEAAEKIHLGNLVSSDQKRIDSDNQVNLEKLLALRRKENQQRINVQKVDRRPVLDQLTSQEIFQEDEKSNEPISGPVKESVTVSAGAVNAINQQMNAFYGYSPSNTALEAEVIMKTTELERVRWEEMQRREESRRRDRENGWYQVFNDKPWERRG